MPSSLSSWEGPLSAAAIVGQVETALLGPHIKQASREAFQAEAVRVALWALSAPKHASSLSDAAASTRRLLALARRLLMPLDDAAQDPMEHDAAQQEKGGKPDDIGTVETALDRAFLELLADQGDLLFLPGGYWSPAPLRLVPVACSHYLLAGGVPTRLLTQTIRNGLRFHGTFRRIDGATISDGIPSSSPWPFQSLESWLGPMPPRLEDLAQDFAAKELMPTSQPQDTTSSALEAYVASLDKPQALRWQPLGQVDDGRYLLRNVLPWGTRQYSIGTTQAHQLTQQSAELQSMDIRRLCYALDHAAGMPTRAKWDRQRGTLTVTSELPARERKLLAAIGQLQTPEHGYYPRRWVNISARDAEKADQALAQLGIWIGDEH